MQILIALMALWLPILAGYQMGRLENAQIEPGGWVETCELQRVDGEVVEVCTPDYYQVRAFALVTLPPMDSGGRGVIWLCTEFDPNVQSVCVSFDVENSGAWAFVRVGRADPAGGVFVLSRVGASCCAPYPRTYGPVAPIAPITLVIPPYE